MRALHGGIALSAKRDWMKCIDRSAVGIHKVCFGAGPQQMVI
jgi:hypothetical protein